MRMDFIVLESMALASQAGDKALVDWAQKTFVPAHIYILIILPRYTSTAFSAPHLLCRYYDGIAGIIGHSRCKMQAIFFLGDAVSSRGESELNSVLLRSS